jgi:hypothetical protein
MYLAGQCGIKIGSPDPIESGMKASGVKFKESGGSVLEPDKSQVLNGS